MTVTVKAEPYQLSFKSLNVSLSLLFERQFSNSAGNCFFPQVVACLNLNRTQYRNAFQETDNVNLSITRDFFFLFDYSLINENKNPPIHCGGTKVNISDEGVPSKVARSKTPFPGPLKLQQGENNLFFDFMKFSSRKFFTFSNKNSSILNLNHSKLGNDGLTSIYLMPTSQVFSP